MTVPPAAIVPRGVLLDAATHLPASPQILAEVNEMLLDPHLQLEDVAVVLRRDATLATAVVRIANSALYPGLRVGSIEDAVARLGMAEVFRAAGLATTGRLAAFALPTYGIPPGGVGRASLLHALALESLAPFARIDPLVAYTTGLLRPLGLMIIDHIARGRGEPVSTPSNSSERQAVEWAAVGADHPQVAAWVLEVWRFSPEVVEAIAQQYLPRGIARSPRLALALNLAGSIVQSLGEALPVEASEWQPNPEKLQQLEMTEEQLACAQERTAREFQRQSQALS